jgi:hypothetical protein
MSLRAQKFRHLKMAGMPGFIGRNERLIDQKDFHLNVGVLAVRDYSMDSSGDENPYPAKPTPAPLQK